MRLLALIIVILLCPVHISYAQEQVRELSSIISMKSGGNAKKSKQNENLRVKVLVESAHTLAFQAGVKWRYAMLMQAIEIRQNELDRIFNFYPLLIEGRVLPPVIQWADKSTTVEANDYATSVDAQYRIISPARIVSTPPSWRDYLCFNFEALESVAPEVLPVTSKERDEWQKAATNGWAAGVSHANEIFALNMDKLTAEYRGILRFKMLADKGIVSVPILAEGNLGVQIGDNVLNVNQQTFRITVPAAFRAAEQWRGGR